MQEEEKLRIIMQQRRMLENTILQKQDNKTALKMNLLYPTWQVGVKYTKDCKVQYNNKLYKVLQEHTSQENWKPDIAVTLYQVIDEEHEGTIDDPIPAAVNMIYYKDKYYIENGTIYKCIRDSEIALQYMPSQLLNIYFVKAGEAKNE